MTTVLVPHRYSFGGLSFNTLARHIVELEGDGLRPVRGSNSVIPGLPGRRWARKSDDEGRYGLTLYVGSWDEDGNPYTANAAADAQRNVDELLTTLGRSRKLVLPLVHTLPDGSLRTTQAEAIDASVNWASTEAAIVVVDFLLHDPYWYGPTILDGPRAITAQTDWQLTHPGTVRGHRIVLTWAGPIENPRLTNLTNGVYVEALVAVATATELVIDCGAWTALNNGAEAIGSVVHEGDFPFMVLEPGLNDLRATATVYGAAATLELSFAPPSY